jgi:diguanylate cyclase (GGDEF)-like protein
MAANRIFFTSVVSAAYAAASGYEFSRQRPQALKMRRPMAALLCVHAVLLVARGLYALLAPPPTLFEGDGLFGLLLAEPAVIVLALSLLGVGLVREHAEAVLRRAAATDDLTGVLNRRALLAGAGEGIAAARRDGQPAALLLFDLDHFKSINDRFGHSVGDQTLRTFARIAAQAIRQTDVFGRLGGEEFAAFLAGADARTAHRIAERIRADFSRTVLAPDWPAPTVSVGIAEIAPGSILDVDSLLIRADQALYQAKRAGRDRVVGTLALAS